MRKVCAALLALFVLLPAACSSGPKAVYPERERGPAAGAALDLDGMSLAAENRGYQLWVDPEAVSFEIRSGEGLVWKSKPDFAGDAAWVDTHSQKAVSSLLTVTLLDAAFRADVLPSEEAKATLYAVPGGVRFSFSFERQRVTVPLDIVLTDDGFTARIYPGDVREDGDFLFNSALVLPYFNSGSDQDDGFLFYPDGSGALCEYGKDYGNVPDVIQPVYGFDRGIGVIEVSSQTLGYRMPVFGAKTNETSYIAIIEEPSAFVSSVRTGIARSNLRYFTNGAVFTYRDVGRVNIRENVYRVNAYVIPSPVTATAGFSARYILLSGTDADYNDMALAYRRYLEDRGVLSGAAAARHTMHLTLTGALKKPSNFLGVPMTREIALTTFDQAGEILETLEGAGIGRSAVFYKGAQKGGFNSRWTRDFKFNGKLGGRKGWDGFLTGYGEGHTIYLNGELMQIYQTGRGFSASRHAARTTGNGINFQYPYHLLDGTRDTSRRWHLLSPWSWEEAFGNFAYGAEAAHLSVEDAGELVFSEYDKKTPLYRDITGPMLTGAIRHADALSYGNAYTWGAVDVLYDVPLGASGYFIQSREVPFYQLVVSGFIEYSGVPMNLSPDKHLFFLRSVEYGALPHYTGIYKPSAELNRSVLEGLFSACYLDWLPDAAGQAELAGDLWERINGSRMERHERVSDGVFRTVYENGATVTVDYNTRTFEVAG
jgi:hypothetical protein